MIVLRDNAGEPYALRREARLTSQGVAISAGNKAKLTVFPEDDTVLYLTTLEMNILVQWYLHEVYDRNTLLPGTPEYIEWEKETAAKWAIWNKEMKEKSSPVRDSPQ